METERVKQDIFDVITGRVETPEMIIDPKRGVGEGIVLLGRAHLEPDLGEPGERKRNGALLTTLESSSQRKSPCSAGK